MNDLERKALIISQKVSTSDIIHALELIEQYEALYHEHQQLSDKVDRFPDFPDMTASQFAEAEEILDKMSAMRKKMSELFCEAKALLKDVP